MPTPISIIDAFANGPFTGNPAAVCRLEDPSHNAAWMQSVAAEMNLSETAFVAPTGQPAAFSLRWFTPKIEVALCGHATLAAAHTLWTEGGAEGQDTLHFDTLSGKLTAARTNNGEIALDFPALPPFAIAPPMELLVALGARPLYCGRGGEDILCELDSEKAVRACAPDLPNLAKLEGTRGVIVTAKAASDASGYDFVSRFFAPSVGIDEDPVTGSAHCVLGPYWTPRLGRDPLTGYQASSRGGMVRVTTCGERVTLAGKAITILRGTLQTSP